MSIRLADYFYRRSDQIAHILMTGSLRLLGLSLNSSIAADSFIAEMDRGSVLNFASGVGFNPD